MLYIMNNLNTKQEYWNARKLYPVLKDDTYSYLEVYSYICFFVLCLLHLLPCHLFMTKTFLKYITQLTHIFVDQHAMIFSNLLKCEQSEEMKNICNFCG